MTIVYLIRHSKADKIKEDTMDLQTQNENYPLSLEGKEIAKTKFENSEFANLDVLYSSHYLRAIETAKILSNIYNLPVNIINNIGERKFGISSWDELPIDFERKQLTDEDYKIGNGESQKEVKDRMYNALIKIIHNNVDKKIAIVSHATAISFLLKKWCDINFIDNKLQYIYKGKILLDGYFNHCETFKLVFDGDILINIENIKL